MKRNKLKLIFTVTLCAVWMFSFRTFPDPSPSEILEILNDSDERFDNVQLKYKTTEIRKFGGSLAFGQKWYPPSESLAIYHEEFTVRGEEATRVWELDPSLQAGPDELPSGPLPYQKWTNVGGPMREFVSTYPSNHTKSDYSLDIYSAESSVQSQRMQIEFAHGIGFGKRILSIDKLEKNSDGNYELSGSIKLWEHDVSTYRLVVDDEYVVREAHIETIVDSSLNIFNITTEGTDRAAEILFPKHSHFVRIHSTIVDGKKIDWKKKTADFKLDFKSARFHLSDTNTRKSSQSKCQTARTFQTESKMFATRQGIRKKTNSSI